MSTDERGFTLIEILVSLAIFAIVVVGALGVLGAAGSGGFFEGFPTGFRATRAARDTTAASVYLQAFQEYGASLNSSLLTPGTYCDGSECSSTIQVGGITLPVVTTSISASNLGTYPPPPVQPYQLNWRRLDVTIERWYACFNISGTPAACTATTPCFVKYSVNSDASCTIDTNKEYLVRLRTRLTWRFGNPPNDLPRMIEVDRFLP